MVNAQVIGLTDKEIEETKDKKEMQDSESKKVTVYSTQTCPYCTMVKTFLKEQNIEFDDVDVGKDRQKAIEMVKKSGQTGVPVTEVNGRMVVGFRPDDILKAMNSTPVDRETAIGNVIFDPFDQ
jgi:glutaredoxin-like YruB-family protein